MFDIESEGLNVLAWATVDIAHITPELDAA